MIQTLRIIYCFAWLWCYLVEIQCCYNNNSLRNGQDSVSILKCGHAIHPQCLRKCEQYQNTNAPVEQLPYRCPVNGCKQMYHWRGGKWNYKFIDNTLFDEIRDETLFEIFTKWYWKYYY